MMRTLFSTLAVVTMVAGAAGRAEATMTHDNRTYFTFSQPVAIPGAVLPAGEYIFRLADPDSGRGIVQVLNKETGEAHGMFFTVPAERRTVPESPEVTLGEAPEGMTRSIATWWYPGTTNGRTFLYAPGDASWDHAWHNDSPVGN